MNMRAPTQLERQMLDQLIWRVSFEPWTENEQYLFRDENGYMYVSHYDIPNNPTDQKVWPFSFSQKEQWVIKNFEVTFPQKDWQMELFPEDAHSPQDIMRFSISRMLEILIADGPESAKLRRIIKKESMVRFTQAEIQDWDPEKWREVSKLVDTRTDMTKTRIHYVLTE